MSIIDSSWPAMFRTGALALALGASAFVASTAIVFAGECPADKVVADGQKPGATKPKDVSDTVLAAIDLAQEPAAIENRMLRLRRLVMKPGGEVPWHSHDDRPALIYILSGEVTEYASSCAVPIVHKAGEVAPERHGTAHWWKNTGKKTAVLLSADLLHVEDDEHMM
jgi:quercetin dioxygenase-like cupin family protein